MAIWFKPYTLEDIRPLAHKYLAQHIGIEVVEIGDDYLKASMPVDDRTRMPFGLLHGGASCVLAESLASFGAYMTINPENQKTVGLEINANHIRQAKSGLVIGIARPVHLGRSTQVWDIRINNPEDQVVCISRMTIAVLDKQ